MKTREQLLAKAKADHGAWVQAWARLEEDPTCVVRQAVCRDAEARARASDRAYKQARDGRDGALYAEHDNG